MSLASASLRPPLTVTVINPFFRCLHQLPRNLRLPPQHQGLQLQHLSPTPNCHGEPCTLSPSHTLPPSHLTRNPAAGLDCRSTAILFERRQAPLIFLRAIASPSRHETKPLRRHHLPHHHSSSIPPRFISNSNFLCRELPLEALC